MGLWLHVTGCLFWLLASGSLPRLASAADVPPSADTAELAEAKTIDAAPGAGDTDDEADPAAASEDEAEEDEVVTRESDQLRDKYEEWTGSGFRLHLSVGYAYMGGGSSSPTMNTVDTSVSVGWRFTERWGLMASFRYGALFEGFEGLRWATTIEPLFFITTGLAVSAGLGFGGLMGTRSATTISGSEFVNYSLYVNDPDKIVLSGGTTRPEPPPFPSCDGDAFVAVLRVAYLFTVGDLFSTGPVLQADGQWTVCQDHGFDRHVPIEESHLIPRQLWGHYAIGVAWSAAWR